MLDVSSYFCGPGSYCSSLVNICFFHKHNWVTFTGYNPDIITSSYLLWLQLAPFMAQLFFWNPMMVGWCRRWIPCNLSLAQDFWLSTYLHTITYIQPCIQPMSIPLQFPSVAHDTGPHPGHRPPCAQPGDPGGASEGEPGKLQGWERVAGAQAAPWAKGGWGRLGEVVGDGGLGAVGGSGWGWGLGVVDGGLVGVVMGLGYLFQLEATRWFFHGSETLTQSMRNSCLT